MKTKDKQTKQEKCVLYRWVKRGSATGHIDAFLRMTDDRPAVADPVFTTPVRRCFK